MRKGIDMKTKIALLIVTTILGAIVTTAREPSPSQPQATPSVEPKVALVPVVRVDAGTDMALEFDFRNTSSKPIRYLLGDRLPRSVAVFRKVFRKGSYLEKGQNYL